MQKDLVKKFGLEVDKHMETPMGTTAKLTKDENSPSVDPILYKNMIGSLVYLVASHLDISYNVEVFARYQANPKTSHLVAMKRIICYLNEIVNYGIWYSKDISINLVSFCDTDWADNASN